jgi:hypothetical protein
MYCQNMEKTFNMSTEKNMERTSYCIIIYPFLICAVRNQEFSNMFSRKVITRIKNMNHVWVASSLPKSCILDYP